MAISEKDFREMPPNCKYRLTILFIPADRKSTRSSQIISCNFLIKHTFSLRLSSRHILWDCSFNELQCDTTILISHSSEIAAHKTVWKIIWSIKGLHSRDKFGHPITVTDVTLTLIKNLLSPVENIVLNFNYTASVYNLYHLYTKADFGDENISHRLNISMNTVIDHRTNKHDIRRFRVHRNTLLNM